MKTAYEVITAEIATSEKLLSVLDVKSIFDLDNHLPFFADAYNSAFATRHVLYDLLGDVSEDTSDEEAVAAIDALLPEYADEDSDIERKALLALARELKYRNVID